MYYQYSNSIQIQNTIYSRFKKLIGASEIFLLNRISLISKVTYLLIKIQEIFYLKTISYLG